MSSRYGGQSKQTDGMGPRGETLLDYSVFDALRAGFGRVVFIIRRETEDVFRERVVRRLERRLPVSLVFQDGGDLPPGFTAPAERSKPWGTGHAVRAARHEMREPFCVINADDFYGRAAFEVLGKFLRAAAAAPENGGPARFAMAGFRLKDTLSEHGKVSRGVCAVNASGELRGVEELTDIYRTESGAENRPAEGPPRSLTGGEIVSMNVWGFTPAVFPLLERDFAEFLRSGGLENPKAEFYIPAAVDAAIQKGDAVCEVLPVESRWFGVTYQEDRPRVREALRLLAESGAYPSPLWPED